MRMRFCGLLLVALVPLAAGCNHNARSLPYYQPQRHVSGHEFAVLAGRTIEQVDAAMTGIGQPLASQDRQRIAKQIRSDATAARDDLTAAAERAKLVAAKTHGGASASAARARDEARAASSALSHVRPASANALGPALTHADAAASAVDALVSRTRSGENLGGASPQTLAWEAKSLIDEAQSTLDDAQRLTVALPAGGGAQPQGGKAELAAVYASLEAAKLRIAAIAHRWLVITPPRSLSDINGALAAALQAMPNDIAHLQQLVAASRSGELKHVNVLIDSLEAVDFPSAKILSNVRYQLEKSGYGAVAGPLR